MAQEKSRGTLSKLEPADKSAADVQVTAEQLLREAASLSKFDEPKTNGEPGRVVSEAELADFKVHKRKEYEDAIRRRRHATNIWLSYAKWEAEGLDFRRARSVFERALEIDYQRVEVWNKYIDMEIQHEFVNSARNLFDRIVHLMPKLDHFWLRYSAFEEALQNFAGARVVFERWMEWKPDPQAWMAYVRFEERCGELLRARSILERMAMCRPNTSTYIKAAKWEESQNDFERAREWFERATRDLPRGELSEQFFIKWSRFEEHQRRIDKAAEIYRQGLALLGAKNANMLEAGFIGFQKRQGDVEGVEDIVTAWRKKLYEKLIVDSKGYDYDAWISLINLHQGLNEIDLTRQIFERAIKYKPKIIEKVAWKRYFYIWIMYALFEELDAVNMEAAGAVYERLAEIIPHKKFSFAKFWKLWAQYCIRKDDLQNARLIYGRAIGQYPNEKVFKNYCEMELRLGEIDRCRKINAKFIECQPSNPQSWLSLVDIELLIQEHDRARHLFEIAITRENMETPEKIWKSYIDVESNIGRLDKARDLFERLFHKTQHWRVLQAKVDFEWKTANDIEKARDTCRRAIAFCKEKGLDAERAAMLHTWLNLEKAVGTPESVQFVTEMVPRKVKMRRTVKGEDGTPYAEEYTAYLFQDDTRAGSALAILEAAKRWRNKSVAA